MNAPPNAMKIAVSDCDEVYPLADGHGRPEFLYSIYKGWQEPDFLNEMVPRSVFYGHNV